MTEQHVIALLGAPTSRRRGEFVYEGQAGNIGVVRGTVTSNYTGRMSYASAPSFIPLPE